MAVNIAAAVKAARIAMTVLKDEKSRKQALTIVLIPVFSVALLLCMVQYLITSPITALKLILSPEQLTMAEEFRIEYGHYQKASETDASYGGGSYTGVVFTDGAVDVVYFNQFDEKYANEPYGVDDIGNYGCGPTAMAIVISSLTGKIVDPVQMAEWSVANGGYAEGSGSNHSLIPTAAKAFGLTVVGDVQKDPQKIIDALASGKLVVALMSKGHFTKSGHFIVLRGVTQFGEVLVADPASYTRSSAAWDFNIIMDEARKGAYAGGAFWIIG